MFRNKNVELFELLKGWDCQKCSGYIGPRVYARNFRFIVDLNLKNLQETQNKKYEFKILVISKVWVILNDRDIIGRYNKNVIYIIS